MFNGILQWAIKQLLAGNSLIGGFVLHAIGDKTCTVIGIVLGYLSAFQLDFQSVMPPEYAAIFGKVLGALLVYFGAYVATPGKAQALAQKVFAAKQQLQTSNA